MASLIRDMDLIRDIMLKIEQGERSFNVLPEEEATAIGLPTDSGVPREEAAKLQYHLDLLVDGKFIEMVAHGGIILVEKITWSGHDFLDSIRDPVIWAKTKEGAKAGGGFTFDLLKGLAKGFLRKQIEERTGIELDM